MAKPVIMPKLAMGHTEGQVIEWLVDEGKWVERGQPVMVVETEKVAYETEAPDAGFFHYGVELSVTVPVGTTVAWLAETDEELTQLQSQTAAPPPTVAEESATAPVPAPAPEVAIPARVEAAPAAPYAEPGPPAGPARTRSGKIKISPVAKKFALHFGLDISKIIGTGPEGRIVKRDVDKALATQKAAPAIAAETWPGEVVDGKRVKAAIPLRGMRKAIADHMQHSLAVSAQLTFMGEIDMTEMIRLRKVLLQKEEEIGVRITFTDLFVLVLAKAVQHVPIVNSSLVGDEIKIWEDINVGVAVALNLNEYETGLIVPVIKNADKMTLSDIGRAVRDLTGRARDGKLTPEDMGGGTITLSNAGAFYSGWAVTTPILNQPEVALVQPGGIFDKPVALDGQVVIRPIMTLCITYDHRVLDGIPMTKFYNRIKELIENPALLHL